MRQCLALTTVKSLTGGHFLQYRHEEVRNQRTSEATGRPITQNGHPTEAQFRCFMPPNPQSDLLHTPAHEHQLETCTACSKSKPCTGISPPTLCTYAHSANPAPPSRAAALHITHTHSVLTVNNGPRAHASPAATQHKQPLAQHARPPSQGLDQTLTRAGPAELRAHRASIYTPDKVLPIQLNQGTRSSALCQKWTAAALGPTPVGRMPHKPRSSVRPQGPTLIGLKKPSNLAAAAVASALTARCASTSQKTLRRVRTSPSAWPASPRQPRRQSAR